MEAIKRFKNTVVEFGNTHCKIKFGVYPNKRIYMALIDIFTDEQVARVTLDIDSVPVIEDMVIIKDYSENVGVYKALLDADVIHECERKIGIGFNFGLICFFKLN